MRYIALEEAFSIPGLGTPLRQMPLRPKKEYAQSWQTKLADFTVYRLPEMDAAGIDIQVLSLDSRYQTLETDHALQRPPSAYVGTNIVFTNGGVFSPAALTGAVLEVGADAVMFSVDYPYESSKDAVEGFERTTLSPCDREKIAHGNAERILRLT